MKIAVYKDRDSKEYKLYESCMFDSKDYNPNFICHIDLPIESAKEESGLPVSTVEYERGFVDGINKIRSQVIDQLNTLYTKKKLVTKVVDCDGYIIARLKSTNDIPKDAKNTRIVFEVEE